MQVEGQVSMAVLPHMVILLSRSSQWIDVDGGSGKVAQMMHKLVLYLFSDLVPILHREIVGYGQINLSMKLMSQPPHSNVGDLLYTCYMTCGLLDLIHHPWVHSIDEATEYHLHRTPDDTEDGKGDDNADKGICPGIAQPDTEGTKEDRQTGQAVNSGMAAVSDQSSTVDIFPCTASINSN